MMKLYTYFRSSCSYRLRIAINLKGLEVEHIPVNLREGEQYQPPFLAVNPLSTLPVLVDGKTVITQSFAAMEYLEEKYPSPALLPNDLETRAKIRSFCLAVIADIQPLQNLKILQYLEKELGVSDTQKTVWLQHWIGSKFLGMEKLLRDNGLYCFGDGPTLADVCLVPQVFAAMRFNVDLQPFPKIRRIYEHCLQLEAFEQAKPELQKDAV